MNYKIFKELVKRVIAQVANVTNIIGCDLK
jgi:hypothetical protein